LGIAAVIAPATDLAADPADPAAAVAFGTAAGMAAAAELTIGATTEEMPPTALLSMDAAADDSPPMADPTSAVAEDTAAGSEIEAVFDAGCNNDESMPNAPDKPPAMLTVYDVGTPAWLRCKNGISYPPAPTRAVAAEKTSRG